MTTLSGSITLKRLKKGVNVILSIETENAALYQGWNDKQGIAVPDFKSEANQPVLVPKVVATNNASASITNGTWYYNNTMLVATGTSVGNGFYKCTDARFAINSSNFKLRIIDNVASASNVSNDMFKFECAGEASGTAYEETATIELHLQVVGSSACSVYIEGGCTLSTSHASETLKAHFFIDGVEMTDGYTFKWTREDGTSITAANGASCPVTRSDIDGIGGVYCSVFRNGETTALATDYHKMTDISDEYEFAAVENRQYDDTDPNNIIAGHVTSHIYKLVAGKLGEEVKPKGVFTHNFASTADLTKKIGTLTEQADGKGVDIGSDIWGQVTDDQNLQDFITYEV